MSRVSDVIEDLKLAFELMRRAHKTLETEFSVCWKGCIDHDQHQEIQEWLESVEYKADDIQGILDEFKH